MPQQREREECEREPHPHHRSVAEGHGQQGASPLGAGCGKTPPGAFVLIPALLLPEEDWKI